MFFSVQSPFCFFCPFNKPSENIDLDEKSSLYFAKPPWYSPNVPQGLKKYWQTNHRSVVMALQAFTAWDRYLRFAGGMVLMLKAHIAQHQALHGALTPKLILKFSN